jgi:hypothetical protein
MTLGEAELMDGEMAFEMLNLIYHESAKRGERGRLAELVAALQEHRPEAYDQKRHYFLSWQIGDALASGSLEALPKPVQELAGIAERDIDLFDNVLDQLAYHGQLALLVEAVRMSWPQIEEGKGIVPWGVHAFAHQASAYEIFDYVEQAPSPDAGDPELPARLETYLKVDPQGLAQELAYLSGGVKRDWTVDDFQLPPPAEAEDDVLWDDEAHHLDSEEDEDEDDEGSADEAEGRRNLLYLSHEFLGYLRRDEGVPYPKGELAREQLCSYLLKRHAGELEHWESPLGALASNPKRKPKRGTPRADHPLCPDQGTLDRFFGGLLNFFNPQHYKAVATFELIPAWLRFLISRRLLGTAKGEQALQELKPLHAGLLEFYRNYSSDPALKQELERWPE